MTRVQDYGPAPLDEPDAYPGTWPTGSVVVEGQSVTPFDASAAGLLAGRTPIVAYGANACPAQLVRKALGGPVVLTPTTLRNHLVVYARQMSADGLLPGTVARWPGASTQVFLTWLTSHQQRLMDLSEGGAHHRVMLPTTDGLVAAYRSRTGFTLVGRRLPVRVAGIVSRGRSLPPAMTQSQVLVHRRAAAG